MPEISVIVPVYNASEYLRETLLSYTGQTFKDIEIILINDGSTDNSIDIIREFERLDSRIIVFDGKNRGVDAARNTGIDVAKGKYISFLDADDIADYSLLEKLYKKIEQENADLAICGHKVVLMNGEIKERLKHETKTIKISNKTERVSLMNEYIPGNGRDSYALWNKLFRKEVIDRNNIRHQSHKHLYYDDTAFCYIYLLYADSICFIDESLYKYIIRQASITTSFVSDGRLRFFNYCEYLQKNLQKHNMLDECKASLAIIAFNAIVRLIHTELNSSQQFFENYKSIKEIISDVNFRKIVLNMSISRLPYKRKVLYIFYKFRLYFIALISFKLFIRIKD